ncbi:hypothetical protein ACHAXM_011293, partial [Skeletonema potamos]
MRGRALPLWIWLSCNLCQAAMCSCTQKTFLSLSLASSYFLFTRTYQVPQHKRMLWNT